VINREASTIEVTDMGIVYICEASGMPPPMIQWLARDLDSGQELPITSSTNGIEIATLPAESNVVTSELTISQNSGFATPVCMASNDRGSDTLQFMEVSTGTSISYITACLSVFTVRL
jgi:hypothetical protein